MAFRSRSFWLKWQLSPTVGWTFLLGAGLFAHAAAFSQPFEISALKITSWLIATTTIFSAWHGLQPSERNTVSSRLFGGLTLLMFLSLPLLPTSIGYYRNGRGFQGLLNHPQAFGLTMALLGTRRGGPAKVAVASSAMFGTISGSAVANVVSSGIVTIPLAYLTLIVVSLATSNHRDTAEAV